MVSTSELARSTTILPAMRYSKRLGRVGIGRMPMWSAQSMFAPEPRTAIDKHNVNLPSFPFLQLQPGTSRSFSKLSRIPRAFFFPFLLSILGMYRWCVVRGNWLVMGFTFPNGWGGDRCFSAGEVSRVSELGRHDTASGREVDVVMGFEEGGEEGEEGNMEWKQCSNRKLSSRAAYPQRVASVSSVRSPPQALRIFHTVLPAEG
ncbi:hypothetical protein BDZ91DRAFT_358060 [Kalaharituber pfeilii]|nr:hypothetical protein BDZ91DRAFT_358060 [Kalaharituber pfeilii]